MIKIDIGIISFNRIDILKKNISNCLIYEYLINKIIIVNNGTKNFHLNEFSSKKIFLIDLKDNLGVSRARNLIFQSSSADFLIMIDDDAIIYHLNIAIKRIIKYFKKFNNLALIQFRIIDYNLNKTIKREYPQNLNFTHSKIPILSSYFIGAGFVLRKNIFKNYFFDEKIFYAQEDIDLSFRLINDNFFFIIDNKIPIMHYRDKKGRLNNSKVIESNFFNRLVINYKYLPINYLIFSSMLWFCKSVLDSRSIFMPIKTLIKFLKYKKKIKRSVLNHSSISFMKNTNGRLLY